MEATTKATLIFFILSISQSPKMWIRLAQQGHDLLVYCIPHPMLKVVVAFDSRKFENHGVGAKNRRFKKLRRFEFENPLEIWGVIAHGQTDQEPHSKVSGGAKRFCSAQWPENPTLMKKWFGCRTFWDFHEIRPWRCELVITLGSALSQKCQYLRKFSSWKTCGEISRLTNNVIA